MNGFFFVAQSKLHAESVSSSFVGSLSSPPYPPKDFRGNPLKYYVPGRFGSGLLDLLPLHEAALDPS
jgi:hypothetical protein